MRGKFELLSKTLVCGFLFVGAAFGETVVINEIMFHPAHSEMAPEPVGEEFIELFNGGALEVNLGGWRFSRGVDLTLGEGVLPAGGFLVVASDREAFLAKHPEVTNVVGGWSGNLSNHGEELRLENAQGELVDRVDFATEGDWARRQRGEEDRGHRGWKWLSPADGLGHSLERRNPFLDLNQGQNWAASESPGGTPGEANSVFSANIPPVIMEVNHSPVVPRSTEKVAVAARLADERAEGLTAAVYFRVDAAPQTNAFLSLPMMDDGLRGDGLAGDGVFGAVLPAQSDGSVVEFYIEAMDAEGKRRTWPGPVVLAEDGTGTEGQVANALYQVDDDPANRFGGVPSRQPVYKLIMTEVERAELESIPCSSSQNSNAEMNGTFISLDGRESMVRYLCGFRNRGHGTRCASPPNYRVNFRTDRRWKGVRSLNLNSRYTYVQHFGAVLNHRSGLAGGTAHAVQVRVNGANLAHAGSPMYGSYVANEVPNANLTDRQFPEDGNGNLYRAIRDIDPPDFLWRGPDAEAYTNTYFKETHVSANAWDDIIQLHRIVGTNDLFTTSNVREVVDVEQWMLYLAVMALENNRETSPNRGYNDDYLLYRGEIDPRFNMLYYDSDTILGEGDSGGSTDDTIFGATRDRGIGVTFNRLMHWPDFEPIYFATLQRLLDTSFAKENFDALVDQTLGGYVPPQVTDRMKSWMDERRAYVQSVIDGMVPSISLLPVAEISGEPRSPTPWTTATLTVSGLGVTQYRFRLNDGAFGPDTPVTEPIRLSGLPDGSTNTVRVIGGNDEGTYQDEDAATVSMTWRVNTTIPPVRLNEVLASNNSALNRGGTFPDGIELFNEGRAAVDLSGMQLTDNPTVPDKFVFPAAARIEAGEYLGLFANDEDGSPGYHLGFKLNQDGESVFLYDAEARGGALLDKVTFGRQIPDTSIGRLDDSGAWRLCTVSLGAANTALPTAAPTALKINEWLAAGSTTFGNDWIEIFNPDPLPVAMGGLYLTDEPIGAPDRHRIADLSFIAGGGFVVFDADGSSGGMAGHLNFRLSADLGEIGLFTPDGTPIDHVVYGPQLPGVAQGRCPNGNSRITNLTLPTPEANNVCPAPPPPPVLVTLIPGNQVWSYEQSGTDLGTEWRDGDYDDSEWPSGPAALALEGCGCLPEPIRTPLTFNQRQQSTFYFRSWFDFDTSQPVSSVQLTHLIDDGAVFYLNGREVARYHLGTPMSPVDYEDLASDTVSNASYEGPVPISATNLVHGPNLMAVEVHQTSLSSSDIVFGMKLEAVIATNSPVDAGVILNEVLANNLSFPEADGSTPDWIEIYNPSPDAVDLTDMSLSDSIDNPRRWVFPSPFILPAQSYRIIRCDPSAPASADNAGFGLEASGDAVYLFNNREDGGAVLDFIRFGFQTADFAIGRTAADDSAWSLTVPTPGAANLLAAIADPATLKINEWMAAPGSGDDWFEIFNPNRQPAALGGLWLSDDLSSPTDRKKHRIMELSFLGSGAHAYGLFQADDNVAAGADHVSFKLSASAGDAIGLSDPAGELIDGVSFGPQESEVSEGRVPDGASTIARFPDSPSPGESNYLPLPNVVINELLSHSDPPLEDAVELLNLGQSDVDLGGWWLSDSSDNLRKFPIPADTVLPAGGFAVFYEYQFNDVESPHAAFAFNSVKGDQCYLSQATADGNLTGYRAQVHFGPSENGISFGRYLTSDGRVEFVPMSSLSFGTSVTPNSHPDQISTFRTGRGAPNPYPQVGPVVISEIMYHPPDMGTQNSERTQFIELHNITAETVPLYDPAHTDHGWMLREGVEFKFQDIHAIPPGGYLVVVGFDPVIDVDTRTAFETAYGAGSRLVGPFSGNLANSGETISLVKPDAPQMLPSPEPGFVPYLLVERVAYSDHDPWPAGADGLGASLQRIQVEEYGNDPANWLASTPTPGPFGLIDTDNDGMADDWERDQFGDLEQDGSDDYDGDGMCDLGEYRAGTDPRDPSSILTLSATIESGSVHLQFHAVSGKSYSVLYSDSMPAAGEWHELQRLNGPTSSGTIYLRDGLAGQARQRYYRVVSPARP